MKKKVLDLGVGPILPLLIKMSWPSMLAMLSMAIFNVMDSLWLARLSPRTIAAFTITFPLQMVFAAIGVGIGVGAGSYASRMFGAGEEDKARRTAGQVIFLSLSAGLALIAITYAFPDYLLRLFGASGETLVLAKSYLMWIVLTSPFLLFMMMANNLFRAEGLPNLSMYAILTFTFLGGLLDPLLIFGWGGFPALGIQGAALAAMVGQVASGLLSLYFLLFRSLRYRIDPRDILPDPAIIRAIHQTGLPSVLMNLVFSTVIVIYNNILAQYGHLALATLGICFRINGLVMMVLFGIGHGVMPMVGYNLGAKLYDRLIATVGVAVRCSTLFAGASSAVILFGADFILGFFTDDQELLAIAAPALKIFISSLVLAAPSIVWINLFIGLGKGLTAMTLMFIRDVLFLIPLMYLFSLWLGRDGVWMAQPVSTAVAFLIIWAWSAKELAGIRRLKGPMDHQPPEPSPLKNVISRSASDEKS
ncbi:MAG: MATE family efflux transporter [Pseudomonadota bacterium]|nr:MATE family efflux transporter [Pseudomonadota bacterium]